MSLLSCIQMEAVGRASSQPRLMAPIWKALTTDRVLHNTRDRKPSETNLPCMMVILSGFKTYYRYQISGRAKKESTRKEIFSL